MANIPDLTGHPLNRQRVGWWLCIPPNASGIWWDLTQRTPGSNAGSTGCTWTTSSQRGGFGACWSIPALPAYITLGSSPALSFGASDITIAGWINTTTRNITIVGGYNASSPYPGYGVQIDINWKIGYWNGANISWCNDTGSALVSTGSWVHWVVAASNPGGTRTTQFYINGQATSTITGTNAGQCSAWAGNRNLGKDSSATGNGFGGLMDDVSIWSRALSAPEVWQLYLDSMAGYKLTLTTRKNRRKLFGITAAAAAVPVHFTPYSEDPIYQFTE